MSFVLMNMLPRLRDKVDPVTDQKDILTQDGSSYTVKLNNSPVVSGSDLPSNGGGVYINHASFTTGLLQYVPQNTYQSAAYASGTNLVYGIDYRRGELNFYRGSGYVIGSGLSPFAPWSTSDVAVYYQSVIYTDNVLASYLAHAVAEVESSIQIGMVVSGIGGASPVPPGGPINQGDYITRKNSSPYANSETLVIAEDVEILQELISTRAALSLVQRERRIGSTNAIMIKDGDQAVDLGLSQKLVTEVYKDLKIDYDKKLGFIMQNMIQGFSLRTIDETSYDGGYYSSWYSDGL